MKRQKTYPSKKNIITSTVVIAAGLTLLNTSAIFATTQNNVSVNSNQTARSFTSQDALKVSKGELHSEDNLIDKSLYGEKPLDPEGDDDHDGIKNKDELYVYSKNGKEYLGYYSHPLLEDSDGDGLLDNKDDNKTKWYMTDRDAVLFMELSYRNDEYIKKF